MRIKSNSHFIFKIVKIKEQRLRPQTKHKQFFFSQTKHEKFVFISNE